MAHALWIAGIILLAIIAAYAAYSYGTIRQALAIGHRIAAQAVPYEQHPADPSAYVLVMGDSTAVGTGAATGSDSIAGLLGTRYPNADITNISENGLTYSGLAAKLPLVPRGRYDLIVLQIGANDVTGRVPFASTSENMQAVLSFASAHADHVIAFSSGNIGLAPIFHWPLAWYFTERTLRMRSLYMRTVAEFPNVTYIDLFKSAEDDAFGKDVPLYYAADRYHPSSAGYALWFADIAPHLPALPRGK